MATNIAGLNYSITDERLVPLIELAMGILPPYARNILARRLTIITDMGGRDLSEHRWVAIATKSLDRRGESVIVLDAGNMLWRGKGEALRVILHELAHVVADHNWTDRQLSYDEFEAEANRLVHTWLNAPR